MLLCFDLGQVSRRIDSVARTRHRDVRSPAQWNWDEFGASYGETLENLCDYEGAKLAVRAGRMSGRIIGTRA